MTKIETKYGIIESSNILEYDRAGNLRSVIASSRCILNTRYGKLVPNYSSDEPRKKYRSSVSFFEDGSLESVYLEEPVTFHTSIGTVEAELITFYKEGNIRRLFPRYGQINGYWSEEDEYQLFPEIEVEITGYKQKCKAFCIDFYENGTLEGITIWRKTPLVAKTIFGNIETKFGLQMYNDGRLKSIEPLFGTKLHTLYGEVRPSNRDRDPFHAEDNSLLFWPDGNLRLVKTMLNEVEIIKKSGEVEIVCPREKEDLFDPDVRVKEALEIEFFPSKIVVSRQDGTLYTAEILTGDQIRIK